MTEVLFHEHRGKVHPFLKGADQVIAGVWYARWLCSANCSTQVLVRKSDADQHTVVRSGEVNSVYGLTVDEIVIEKKTGRRARVERFSQRYGWITRDGRKTRVPINAWDICYRWLEAAPGRTRLINELLATDNENFFKRFRKQEEDHD